MLGWYIPGLSELPLGNRLPLLPGGPFQRFFVFSISLGTFGPFFLFSSFVSCACVYSEHGAAGEPGTVAGGSGCWRVLAGREGGERSAVAAFVPRRRVYLKTRGKHEWALSGLHLHNSIAYVGVYKGRTGFQGKIQAVLIFATGLKTKEGATPSEQQHCRAGERPPR